MSLFLVQMWLIIVMTFSMAAIPSILVFTHSEFWHKKDKLFKIGFLMLCTGLAIQTVRSLFYLKMSMYPIDYYFPLWIVKDIGFVLMVISFHRQTKANKEP